MSEEQALQIVEYQSQRVLTTAQIAQAYGTIEQIVTNNFNRNKDKYQQGKHYIRLEGHEKAAFLGKNQIDFNKKDHKPLYLWTEKGAFLHAKSLNTERAWEVYDRLIDAYYRLVTPQGSGVPSQELPVNALMYQRLRLFYDKTRLRMGYWCVFGEVAAASYYYPALVESALPDGSVGRHWMNYVRQHPETFDLHLIATYKHCYPDHRGWRDANQYPNAWLGAFRTWFQQIYLKEIYPTYIETRMPALPETENHQALPGATSRLGRRVKHLR